MYTSNRANLTQSGTGDNWVGGVQRKMPVRQILWRKRLFPFCIFSLFFYFQIPKYGHQHNKHDTTQTATDD